MSKRFVSPPLASDSNRTGATVWSQPAVQYAERRPAAVRTRSCLPLQSEKHTNNTLNTGFAFGPLLPPPPLRPNYFEKGLRLDTLDQGLCRGDPLLCIPSHFRSSPQRSQANRYACISFGSAGCRRLHGQSQTSCAANIHELLRRVPVGTIHRCFYSFRFVQSTRYILPMCG